MHPPMNKIRLAMSETEPRRSSLEVPDRYSHVAGDPERVTQQESNDEVSVDSTMDLNSGLVDSHYLGAGRNIDRENFIDD
jgi:hypothetical protein